MNTRKKSTTYLHVLCTKNDDDDDDDDDDDKSSFPLLFATYPILLN